MNNLSINKISTPLIFLIFGPPTAGKSTFLECVMERFSFLTIHRKGAERPPRINEIHTDILAGEIIDYHNYDYIYSNFGRKYGLQKRQIDDSIGKNKHHLIVASNISIIEKIKEDYEGIVRTIFIYPKTDAKKINEIFIERACSQEIVELNLKLFRKLKKEFLLHKDIFDLALYNNFMQSPENMIMLFEKLLYLESIRNCKDKKNKFEFGITELKKSVTEISKDLKKEGDVFDLRPGI